MKISTFDETTSGIREEGPFLELSEPKMTVGTLIESRIRAEVDAQLAGPSFVRRLVRPIEETSRKIDIPGQIETARDAFDRGQLLVLLPTRQAESLDETLTLSDGDEVTFLRLVPLIGG